MKHILVAAAVASFGVTPSLAQELNIYNWGNYTNPKLIEKFEAETGIKVTITDYDSNDTALAKVKAGGHGFDVVVPSATYVPIWVGEGLLAETRPDQMENFKNVDPATVVRLVYYPLIGNDVDLVDIGNNTNDTHPSANTERRC